MTTRIAEGVAIGYDLTLTLRNVGNGAANIDEAWFELPDRRVVGTPDRAVVPKDEAFRLAFDIDEPAAFREALVAQRIPSIEVIYADAARQTAGRTTVDARLDGPGPDWDVVVTAVHTSPARTARAGRR